MEHVIFRVPTDDIDDVIGDGTALRKGVYGGTIEWRSLAVGGQSKPYIAKASLFLSPRILNSLGVRTSAAGFWARVTQHVESGRIQILEASGNG
jgi:hypothetical protein